MGAPAILLALQQKLQNNQDISFRLHIREHAEHVNITYGRSFHNNKFAFNTNVTLGKGLHFIEPGFGIQGNISENKLLRMDYFPRNGAFAPSFIHRG